MAVKISISDTDTLSIRIESASRVEVGATGRIKIIVEDGPVVMSVTTRSRARDRREPIAESRRIAGGLVTSAMEAAAIKAFLDGADVSRLGRSLSCVYAAMEAVRRRQGIQDDDDD